MSVTTKKKPRVFRDGFKYVVHKLNANGTVQYWRCQQFRSCHGRAVSEVGTFDIRPTQPHNHPPVEERSPEELESITVSENFGMGSRRRKKTHPIWNCFTEIEEEGKRKNKCIQCSFTTEDSVHATLRSHVRKFHSIGPASLYTKLVMEVEEYMKNKETQQKPVPSQVYVSEPTNPTEKLQFYLDSIEQKTEARLDQVINDVLENTGRTTPADLTSNMNVLNSSSSSFVPGFSTASNLNLSEKSKSVITELTNKQSTTVFNSPSTSMNVTVKEEITSPVKKKRNSSDGTDPSSPFLMLPENLLNVFQEAASGKPTTVFSLSSTSSISDLLNVAKELKLKFMFDAGCGSEYCLSRDGSSEMLVIVDFGSQVIVKTKNNNIVVEEVIWSKAEWDQFLWAIRDAVGLRYCSIGLRIFLIQLPLAKWWYNGDDKVYGRQDESFVAVNSHKFIDFPVPKAQSIVEIGNFPKKEIKQLDTKIEKFMDSYESIVYFSMSTYSNDGQLPNDLVREFIATFTRFPKVGFIWRLKGGLVDSIPRNVMFVDWIDQRSLLSNPKTKVLITHCGMNSVLEAFHAGVPMIGIPTMGDQFPTAERIKRLKSGIILNIHTLNEIQLSYSLRKILKSDSPETKSAKKIKDMLEFERMKGISLDGVHNLRKFVEINQEKFKKFYIPKCMDWISHFCLDWAAVLIFVIMVYFF